MTNVPLIDFSPVGPVYFAHALEPVCAKIGMGYINLSYVVCIIRQVLNDGEVGYRVHLAGNITVDVEDEYASELIAWWDAKNVIRFIQPLPPMHNEVNND